MSEVKEVMHISQPRLFTDEALAEITSIDDVLARIESDGLPTVSSESLGTGFKLLDKKHKAQLIGVEFFILDWRFNEGDHGDFVSINLITRDGRKFVLNDGSTGICAQMRLLTKKLNGGRAVTRVPDGLHRSEYTYVDRESGVETPAETYYLSTEPK